MLGRDLQDLSSDTDKEILSLIPILLPTSFPSFNFFNFDRYINIFMQPDDASFPVLFLIYHSILERNNFSIQVHGDSHLIFACILCYHLKTSS